ncbi:MAG: elongation factor P [Deltaproteobacteria bacterium]|nr:elongation factor P [Deltaproteobacteria bacterium]
MINATQIRVGNILRIDGGIFRVMTVQHITPGKGNAQVQADLRNLKTGNKNNMRFRPAETVERVDAEEREMTFLYQDGSTYHFMDTETCEQHELAAELLEDMRLYLKPDSTIIMLICDGEALSIRLPLKMRFTVTECDPPSKGSAGALKNALVDTGAHFKVPLFIKPGDVVVINTESGDYVEKG